MKCILNAHFSNNSGYSGSCLYFTDSIDHYNEQRCLQLVAKQKCNNILNVN